ncbi:MAG: hypothetical protein IK130_06780 [Oscillospiraceae bacterium]|nr:hypothetical protein [Oscillospiraceae bacterium]
MADRVLLMLTADGRCTEIPAEESVQPDTLAGLLGTDVTERLRLSFVPEHLRDAALCYFIDARGGEKGLPANFCGTCFYHTGCPIFGDLLLGLCPASAADEGAAGIPAADAAVLKAWLKAEFPDFLTVI